MKPEELLSTIDKPTANPEVINHAMDAEGMGTPSPAPIIEPTAPPKKNKGPVDDSGVVFDPKLHETDKRGRPKKKKNGTWALKRGQKAKDTNGAGLVMPEDEPAAIEQASIQDGQALDPYSLAALQASGLFFLPGQLVWQKTPTDADKSAAQDAFANYFRAYGISEPPPWLGLCIVGTSYYGPLVAESMGKPNNKARLAYLWTKTKAVFARMFRRKPVAQES